MRRLPAGLTALTIATILAAAYATDDRNGTPAMIPLAILAAAWVAICAFGFGYLLGIRHGHREARTMLSLYGRLPLDSEELTRLRRHKRANERGMTELGELASIALALVAAGIVINRGATWVSTLA